MLLTKKVHRRGRRRAGAGGKQVGAAAIKVLHQQRRARRGAPEEAAHQGALVRVLPLVRGDHRGRVLLRPLHSLLHPAPRRRAPVVAPAMHAYVHSGHSSNFPLLPHDVHELCAQQRRHACKL